MKLRYTFLSILAAVTLLSCNDRELFAPQNENNASIKFEQEVAFPTEDGSVELSGNYAQKVAQILNTFGSDIKNDIGSEVFTQETTAEQYNEIKVFTDQLVEGLTTQTEKYNKIFEWINTNIQFYNGENAPAGWDVNTMGPYWNSNRAYDTFKWKMAVCQGYSALLNIMLYSQEIVNIMVNGRMDIGGGVMAGHAWNYVLCDGEWQVSDALNGIKASMNDFNSYKILEEVTNLDCVLYEDDNFIYKYDSGHLNVADIKSTTSSVVIPYSVKGIKVTMFNVRAKYDNINYEPITNELISEIYIGKNITTMGNAQEGKFTQMGQVFTKLSAIYVDPENPIFESQTGVVYTKEEGKYQIAFVSPKVTRIELKPLEIIDKECKLEWLSDLQVIVFDETAEYIYPYAIGNCPSLVEIHAPSGCEFDEMAIYRNSDDTNHYEMVDLTQEIRIVYFEPTGISQIGM